LGSKSKRLTENCRLKKICRKTDILRAIVRYCSLERDHPLTGTQSRSLDVGARVCWSENEKDQGTVVKKSWSGVTLKWDNREEQSIMHNDMQMVFLIR
jgi:hypothetical protein